MVVAPTVGTVSFIVSLTAVRRIIIGRYVSETMWLNVSTAEKGRILTYTSRNFVIGMSAVTILVEDLTAIIGCGAMITRCPIHISGDMKDTSFTRT